MVALLTTIVIVLVFVALLLEIPSWMVYGWFLKETELDVYLGKYLEKATLNPYQKDGTLFCDLPLYISRHSSIFSQWYIEDYGQVPRWSKWNKLISKKRMSLMAGRTTLRKSLKEY